MREQTEYDYYKEREDLADWLKERKREEFQKYINSLQEEYERDREEDISTE